MTFPIRVVVAFATVTFVATAAQAQTTWYVDDDNCPGPGTGTQADPFCIIQDGMDATLNGDEVVVAPGTYNECIDFNSKAITLRSTNPDDPDVVAATIIDGTGLGCSVVKCVSGEGPDTVLEGFTITGGGNATFGGGMFNVSSSPTVTNCTFSGNSAFNSGGGGMSNRSGSHPTVTNCTFSGNSAFNGGGGGMLNNTNSDPTVTTCTFSGNTANVDGGGMYNANESSPTVTNCTFSGNSASNAGGGMYNVSGSSPTVINCTFSGNSAGFSGGGMFNASSSPTITNCILWGDTPDEIVDDLDSTTVVTFSDVQGGWPGVGNIDADPLFVDAASGDLRLLPTSPAIDAADNTAVPLGVTTDLDGNPRFVDDPATADSGNGTPPIVDMGAYEFQGVLVFEAILDIKPGSCPNPVNVRSRGVVPMAIVGSESFDVTEIDIDSLLLTRADGPGGAVTPITRRSGRTGSIEDVATPFGGGLCDCHDLAGDGLDDLVIKFSTQAMANVLELGSESHRASVTLTVSGSLLDGTEFEASDCVVVTGRALTASQQAIQERGKR